MTTKAFSENSQSRAINYTYDGQQRFSAAEVTAGSPQGNLAITQYDANGNIYGGTQDGQNFSLTYSAGMNRLESSTLAENKRFTYRNDGCPSQWRGMKIEYDAALGMTLAITKGSTTVRYARGLNNQRVLRQSGKDLCIHFYGAGHEPLMIWNNGVPQLCIWGANSLVAVHNGVMQYPITDHQSTVWAVTDALGAVTASYDYGPFGRILSQDGGAISNWLFQYSGKSWDADLELYDFDARLYDPALMRFTTPDSMRQCASPYVFVGNDPLNMVDPSGNLSTWAQVSIGVLMAGLAIAGFAASIVSGGAAAVPLASAEGALASAITGGEVAVDAGVAAAEGAAVGAEAAVGTAVEGAAVGVEEVMAGAVASVETATPLTTAQTVSQTAKAALRYGFYGGLQSAGTSGLQYDIQHGRDFSWGDFFKVMGEGFMTGAIKGGINGGVASSSAAIGLLKGRSITASVGLRAMMKAGTSMVGSDLSVLLSDAVTGQKVTPKQLLLASVKGAAIGTVTGAFSGVKAIDPSTTAVKGVEKHLVKASNLINKTANTAKALAKSEDAKGVYITAGTLSAGLYAVWTTFENI